VNNFRSDTLLPLRDVIERHSLFARKSLGQHFLLDSNITAKIVRQAGELNNVHVVEIGPGPGGLTRSLLHSEAQHVYAIEKDERCIGALQELQAASENRLSIIAADGLEFSITEHIPAPRAIVANLPYNVGTLMLIHWLDDIARLGAEAYASLTLMFQKEVADRITANPNSKQYGRLSVMAQWLCDVRPCFTLPASAFTPPPKVDSAVIKLIPRKQPLYPADKKTLEAVLAAAFGQRRKMLRSSLSTLSSDTVKWLESASIDPTRRAETLSIKEFCLLAETWTAHQIKN
jgi:16S rRNA (adenine1518-N6/adenine1519-N6)-dimethyltransferase